MKVPDVRTTTSIVAVVVGIAAVVATVVVLAVLCCYKMKKVNTELLGIGREFMPMTVYTCAYISIVQHTLVICSALAERVGQEEMGGTYGSCCA